MLGLGTGRHKGLPSTACHKYGDTLPQLRPGVLVACLATESTENTDPATLPRVMFSRHPIGNQENGASPERMVPAGFFGFSERTLP